MSDSFTVSVTGLKETQKILYSYSQRLGDFVVYKALRAGAGIIKKEIEANAPVRYGKLKRGFVIRKSKIHRGKSSSDMIGVYITIRKGKDAPYYGRFQEAGWNTRGKSNELRAHGRAKGILTRRAIGKSSRITLPGKTDVPGKKFVEQAFIDKREEAVEMITRTATASAELLARKMGL